MKKYLFLTLCWLPLGVTAQLEHLHHLPADTTQARAIYNQLKSHPAMPFDTLIALAQRGYQAAKSQRAYVLMGQLSQEEAFGQHQAGDLKLGLQRLDRAGRHFLQASDSLRWAKNHINQGLMQYYLGAEDEALVHYQIAASYLDRIGRPSSRLYNNLAIIYRKQEKHERAIDLYRRSLALKAIEGDSLGLAATHQNLGLLYSYLGDQPQALSHQQQALVRYQQMGHGEGTLEVQAALGGIYLNGERLVEAQAAYEQAMTLLRDFPQSRAAVSVHYGLGRIALAQGRRSEAIEYLTQALYQARDQDRKQEIPVLLEHLAQAHYGQGQAEAAYLALAEALDRKDSLADEKRLALTEEMQARFEVQQAEAKQREEALRFSQRERLGWLVLGMAALLLMGAGGFLAVLARKNRQLQQQRRRVEQALAEREAIMREMHHRINNNLQFLSSLLRLQARDLGDAQAQEALLQSRSRVLSMALVHQALYQGEASRSIRMDTYLQRLSQEVIGSLTDPERAIHLDLQAEPLLLDLEQAIPVALIAHEAIVNALKYAFVDQSEGNLWVRLVQEPDAVRLEVADDGRGLHGPTREGGFGQRLIDLLAQQLKGQIQWRSAPGLSLQVRFPHSPLSHAAL